MEIILSTRNKSKIEQIKPIFEGLDVIVYSLADAGVEGEVEEDGETLEANSEKKARFGAEKTGKWTIADDTGLFIKALGGAPGIYAARWAGEGKSTNEITAHTLAMLEGVPLESRGATFRTVATLVSPTGEVVRFVGEISGKILLEKRCEPQPNMPYSPIFQPEGEMRVWAEMPTDEENAISHCGQAFRKLREYLEKILAE